MKGIGAAWLAIFAITPVLTVPIDALALFHDDTNSDPEAVEPELPLARKTAGGAYRVELTWDTVEIKPNDIVSFDMRIIDLRTSSPAESIYYDFVVMKDGEPIKELQRSFALKGTATHMIEFPSSGSFTVTVNVLGSDPLNNGRAVASFDLRVVPEFPTGTIIVAATLVGITVVLTRFTVLSKKTAGTEPAPVS